MEDWTRAAYSITTQHKSGTDSYGILVDRDVNNQKIVIGNVGVDRLEKNLISIFPTELGKNQNNYRKKKTSARQERKRVRLPTDDFRNVLEGGKKIARDVSEHYRR